MTSRHHARPFAKALAVLLATLLACLLCGCSSTGDAGGENAAMAASEEAAGSSGNAADSSAVTADREVGQAMESEGKGGAPELLYQGKASMRIVTPEGKVIYIDPYAGEGYDLAADLILVTHDHFDHSATEMVASRNPDCAVITQREAVIDGAHQTFDLGYVVVEAVQAGFNAYHDVNECAGYVLTFSNGKSVYVTGDTSTTEQMPELAEKQIDYAFYCCDGVYNMGLDEAAEAAMMVAAKHNIPYHMTTTASGRQFDRELAEQFDAPNRLIVEDGESILIE